MNRIMKLAIVILLLYLELQLVECHIKSNRTYAITPFGVVQGYFKWSYKNRPYKCFTGIPFAQPPIGPLRFEPPVPLSKCVKLIKATSPSPSCAQLKDNSIVGKEDCLYLNIYAPVVNREEHESLPVLFWIHGGGFQIESSMLLKTKFIMDRDIMLVTANYRLGVLGFLSTGDHVIPGNMGLKDQTLALQWISENIKYFGGDPNRVTVAGDSAGAAAAHYHYLSPMSAGLFHNGLSFSGCALDPGTFKPDTSDKTRKLANILECPSDNTQKISKCLKSKSVAEIMEGTQALAKTIIAIPVIFLPVAENVRTNYFINSTPTDILKSGKINDVPWMTGVVKDEGLFMTTGYYDNPSVVTYANENWEAVGGELLMFELSNIHKHRWGNLLSAVRQHYFGNEAISPEKASMKKLTRIVGDYCISIGAQRAAKRHAEVNKSPVYFYYYTYRAAMSSRRVGPYKNISIGVSHNDDTALVFEINDMSPTITENDKTMLEAVLDNWYSIVATHKPNVGVPWLDVGSSANFQYMHIAGPGNNRMESNNNLAEIKFWTSIGL